MRTTSLLAVLLALVSPATASAQTVFGPRAAGMGEAFRGVGSSNDAIYLNPAGMSLFPRYSVESFWRRGTGTNANVFSASIVDSRSGPVAAGLAYTYERVRGGDGLHTGSRVELASSYALAPFLLFGVTMRYVGQDTDEGDVSRVTGDTGLMLVLGKMLFIGLTGHNVVNQVEEADVAPRTFGGGVGLLLFDSLQLAADWHIGPDRDDEPMRWMFGAEYFAFGILALRGGYVIDDWTGEQRWSAGLGYVDPGFGLDFAYERTVTSDHPGSYFNVGVRLFF